ncbi:ribulose-phosphate 3-epimerase [candidate division WOR-3 bacterium]|nr:ribulose-phosphate 3-epimerase [candidate division WOR-3 bacterium]
MIQIAPSLLSCDFSRLEKEIQTVEKGGCDLLHLDVMDGHFVPNITFGPVIIKGIRKLTSLPLDVHLMIESPGKWIEQFIDAGADWISFHIEAEKNPGPIFKFIKDKGLKAGIALNPKTPLSEIEPWVDKVDFVLVMTVNPGFGGQGFMPGPLEKIKVLSKRGIKVEVDGGIKLNNISQVVKAGASIIVSGSGVFKTENPGATVKKLKSIVI